MRKGLIAGVMGAAAVAAAVSLAPSAQATPEDFFNQMTNQDEVVWDYPGVLSQGYTVCQMLRNDVNPWSWLVYTVGYDSQTASDVILSARVGLCPGNAVTTA